MFDYWLDSKIDEWLHEKNEETYMLAHCDAMKNRGRILKKTTSIKPH